MSLSLTIRTRRGKLDLAEAGSVWRRFLPYAFKHRWTLLGAMIAAFGATMTLLAMPWTIKVIFDYILTDNMDGTWLGGVLDRVAGSPMAALWWVCGTILVLAVFDGLFNYWRDVSLAQTGQKIVGQLRQDVFKHLQKLPPNEFDQRRTGDLLTRLTGDVLMLRQMLTAALVTGGEGILLMVVMAAAMLFLNVQLGLIALVAVPVTVYATLRIARKIRKATKRQREKESIVANIAHDVISAMPIIQAFNREPIEKERFKKYNRSSVRAGVKTTKLESILYRTVAMGSAVALCLVLLLGTRAVLNDEMTAGDLLVFIAYLRGLAKPMRRIAKVTGQVAKSTTCGRRVAELLDIEPLIKDRKNAPELKVEHGTIRFEGVGFNYPNGHEALKQIDLEIPAGQRVAIVGASGAGKSTLIKLLLRFFDPTVGRVTIDGTDIGRVKRASVRRQIGWVHQDTVLFGLTVQENISLAAPDTPIQRVVDVAEQVQASAFIDRLPKGLETLLGQGAQTLSGGERQRLALARALLHRPKILLLDEPATGLDAVTRRIVSQAWMSEENQATTVVICHRFHEMDRFDRIILLGHGEVVATGSHSDLMMRCPIYAQSYRADRIDGHPAEDPSSENVSC
jgi:ATP-binding cassette subfamily B protein/subfamily B ATP-binding cassette protein MsbA